MQIEYLGNKDLLNNKKIAFLCSSSIGSGAILRCYDWATEMANQGKTIISGFQSKIERDVLSFLLKGKQPIIIVIARKMYKILPEELRKPLEEKRILIISTSPHSARVSRATAMKRNEFISENSDSIVFGYIAENSSLYSLYQIHKTKSQILYDRSEKRENI